MQALPPPPPVIRCMAPENAKGSAYVVLSGNAVQLDAVLSQIKPPWVVEAKAVDHGVGFARLKADINVPYRDVGGLIIIAQARQIAVKFYMWPPVCGLDPDAE